MPHSHMPVKHLLSQLENFEPRRGNRDVRPAWVTGLIDAVADLFEPVDSDVGRVGFDCQFAEERWIVEMYLGAMEVVGGPDDGNLRHVDFRFELQSLQALFDEVEQMHFTALPGDPAGDTRASLLVEGRVGDDRVRLHVYAVPPAAAGPAFRILPDGTCLPV